jgi:general secretion pathway protein J
MREKENSESRIWVSEDEGQEIVERGTWNLERAGRRPAARGFTLLELIIAFSIMGLMASVVFSSFRLALNSYEKSQERLEFEAGRRVLQDLIKRQIGSLYPVRPSASFIDLQEAEAQGQQLAAFSRVPLFYGTPDSMTFTTVAPLMLQENPGLTIVRYGLSQDEMGDFFLGAMEARYLGLSSFMSMVSTPGGEPLPLIERVEDLEFLYYGYDPQSENYQWASSWIGEERLAVPQAVKISYDEKYLLIPINANFFGGRGTRGTRVPQGFQRSNPR